MSTSALSRTIPPPKKRVSKTLAIDKQADLPRGTSLLNAEPDVRFLRKRTRAGKNGNGRMVLGRPVGYPNDMSSAYKVIS
jgi:hypothetical protein